MDVLRLYELLMLAAINSVAISIVATSIAISLLLLFVAVVVVVLLRSLLLFRLSSDCETDEKQNQIFTRVPKTGGLLINY